MQNSDFTRIIESEMDQVEKRISRSLFSGSRYIDECAAHASGSRGKRIRPALVLLSGKACGRFTDQHFDIAAAIELLHTATLLHDDVIDEARMRRGVPSHNAKYGNESAVIFGDYILSCALNIMSSDELQSCRGLITGAVKRVCEGEMIQISRRFDTDITENVYIDIIDKKTASLFAAACEAGAILSGANEHVQKKMYDYGTNIGIAFQIMDDLLDLCGEEKNAGKSLKSDLKKGELTLPLVHLLKTFPDGARVKKMLYPDAVESSMAELTRLIKENGSLSYSLTAAAGFADRAKSFLDCFKESGYKDSLRDLADSVVDTGKIGTAPIISNHVTGISSTRWKSSSLVN